MNISKLILAGTMALGCLFPLSAEKFFDTSAPEKFITLGARIGVNSSNLTVKDDIYDLWNKNSWGTGFEIGAVADIHIREFLIIQPGIFFQSRSGNYTYASRFWVPTADENGVIKNEGVDMVQYGHHRNYNFNIPIIISGRFNIAPKVKWMVDLGPYFNFLLNSTGTGSLYSLRYDGLDNLPQLHATDSKRSKFDFGFKLGTGFRFFNHYYVGMHYLAGALTPWKNEGLGGHNKCWSFTAGYDF